MLWGQMALTDVMVCGDGSDDLLSELDGGDTTHVEVDPARRLFGFERRFYQ